MIDVRISEYQSYQYLIVIAKSDIKSIPILNRSNFLNISKVLKYSRIIKSKYQHTDIGIG